MKSGNLNFLEPSGPLQVFNGTDLPLPLSLLYVFSLKITHVWVEICRFNKHQNYCVFFKLHTAAKWHYRKSINFPHTFTRKTVTTKWAKSTEKNAIFLRLMACWVNGFFFFCVVRSYFILWEICNAIVGGCSIRSTHSMYKIRPRQFIFRFRAINMVKCSNDVNDFNPTSITTFDKYFLQTSLLSTLHIHIAQKENALFQENSKLVCCTYKRKDHNIC